MSKPLNILQLSNKSPYPAKEGGPIAMNNLTQGLIKSGHQVKVVCMHTPKYQPRPGELPETYRQQTRYESVYVDITVSPWGAFKNLFSRKSYHIDRFDYPGLHDKLHSILNSECFDIVLFESVFMAPFLPTVRKYSKAKLILRTHNIEHLIWERVAATTKLLPKKWYLQLLARRLKNYELSVIQSFDGMATITANDARFFRDCGCQVPVTDIPFGLDLQQYQVQQETRSFDLFHLGSMDWMPNQDGIRWFLEKVWPAVNTKHPRLKLFLAGRNFPRWLTGWRNGQVVILGEVEDARSFIQAHGAMIVPLFSGSGVRVKIIEAMAMGKVVITTGIGAEGIHCSHGRDILIGQTPADIIELIDRCIENTAYYKNIGTQARKLIEQEHNNDLIIEKLLDFCLNQCIVNRDINHAESDMTLATDS